MIPRLGLLAVPLIAAAACTAPTGGEPAGSASAAPGECFWASQVTGFSHSGRDVALVHISRRETWELSLAPGCPDVDWAMKIGIVSRGSQRICSGRDAELIVPSASERSADRCLVRSVRKLSPAEADAARGHSPTS